MAVGIQKQNGRDMLEGRLKNMCHRGISAMRLEAYVAFCAIGPKYMGVPAGSSAKQVKAASDEFAEEMFEKHASPTWKFHRKDLKARGLSD